MKIARALIIAAAVAAVNAQVTRAALSTLKHAEAQQEPALEELQTRGGASLLNEATTLASTSNERTLTWRNFFEDPNFKSEVREIPSFLEAYDTIQRTKPLGNVVGRAHLGGLSHVERGKYVKATALLNYYANADAINARRAEHYYRQRKPRSSKVPRSWISDLPSDVQRRIVQHEERRLDLSQLRPGDRPIFHKAQNRAYYQENGPTLRQRRRERYWKAKVPPSAGLVPARSGNELSASNVPVPVGPQEGVFDVLTRPEKSTKLARNSSPRNHTSRAKSPDVSDHAAHSESSTDPLSASPAPPSMPPSASSSEATAVAALQSLRDSFQPRTSLKRLRSFNLNDFPDLED